MKKKELESKIASLTQELAELARVTGQELETNLRRFQIMDSKIAHAAAGGDLAGLQKEVRDELDSLRKELEEVDLRRTLFDLRRDTAAHSKVVDDLAFQVAGLVRLVEVLLHHTSETGVSPNAKIREARRESLREEVEKAKQQTVELFRGKSATAKVQKVPQPKNVATEVPYLSREKLQMMVNALASQQEEVPEQESLFSSEEVDP